MNRSFFFSRFPSSKSFLFLSCFVLAISGTSFQCSSLKSKKLSATHFEESYQNLAGETIQTKIHAKMKLETAKEDLQKFQKIESVQWKEQIDRTMSSIETSEKKLSEDSKRMITLKGILLVSVPAALLIPVPGTFEVLTTIGLAAMAYQRIRETKSEKTKRIVLSNLLDECSEAKSILLELKKFDIDNFHWKWNRKLHEAEHLVVNEDDEKDIRVLDIIYSEFVNDKMNFEKLLKSKIEASQNKCYLKQEPDQKKSSAKKEKS